MVAGGEQAAAAEDRNLPQPGAALRDPPTRAEQLLIPGSEGTRLSIKVDLRERA
jgi:hypothetical protein